MSETSESIKVLTNLLSVTDKSGSVALHLGLTVTLYVENGYRTEARDAVATVCEMYATRCRGHLRWALNPHTEYMEPFGTGKGTNVRERLRALTENAHYSVIFHGGKDDRSASPWQLEALGIERRSYDTLSYVRFSFPLLTEGAQPLHQFVIQTCDVLHPVSGYAGIGVIETPDTYISSKYEHIVYQWAQRFPGLEIDYPELHTIGLSEGRRGGPGIKGVNWLTILADRWLDEMGGIDKVSTDIAALDGRFSIHRYAGGAVIKAGEHPELGDTQRDMWPGLYVKLARYLKPIRITEHPAFHYNNPGRMHKRESEAWLRRFDDR